MRYARSDAVHATHLYAAAAQEEARAISARTKAALQAAKARGVRLGRNGAERLAPANKAAALERAKNLHPVLADLVASGASLREIAAIDKAWYRDPARGPMASNYDRPRTEPAFVNEIEAAAIMELVVWLSVLQMLHRLGAYYRA